jgi:serine/threonine protein kinase
MSAQANQPLPEGCRLDEYTIRKVLAAGGFSFVYLAHDANEMPVAIKEFLPATLGLRTSGEAVAVPQENLAAFRFGLRSFFEEGKALANLSHPNVVRVLNFFRANETVYLVMRYERGRTLQEHVRARQGAPREEWLRSTFANLLNGLREVHSNRLLHLDIKPANIYLRTDATPLLIDFGAARQTLGAQEPALPPMYTPGFASPEHYGRRVGGDRPLGPWSDVYSIGACLYACLSGRPPQPADRRLERDELVAARRAWAGRYSTELLDIVDWCLQLDHLQRPPSVFALQKALLGEKAPDFRGAALPLLDQIRGALFRLARREGDA